MKFEEYIKVIENNIKNLSEFNIYLTSKDLEIIKKWYSKNIPVDIVSKKLARYIHSLPKRKRKYISLTKLDQELNKAKSIKIIADNKPNNLDDYEIKFLLKKLKEYNENIEFSNLSKFETKEELKEYLKLRLINLIWNNLSPSEKNKLKKEAYKELNKKFNLLATDKKSALKILIANKIKKLYGIP